MLLDEKSLNEIDLDDMRQLIAWEVCESSRLDYKRQWWESNDDGRREMLRDISALANSYGGYIVVGIATESATGASSNFKSSKWDSPCSSV